MKHPVAIEDFLVNMSLPITIVGGSPLYDGKLPDAISINGFHEECSIAAINSQKSDATRVANFDTVLQPYPKHVHLDRVLLPSKHYDIPHLLQHRRREPTTLLRLILITEALQLNVCVFGVCGWATRHHFGDLEMHWLKHCAKHVKVIDPRPKW